MSVFANFVGGSFTAASAPSGNEALINWIVKPREGTGEQRATELEPSPGVRTRVELATAGGRGAFYADGRLFVVYGTKLYEITENWTATERGTVASDANPALFSWNGEAGGQLGIVSGGNVYCYDLSTDTLTTELTTGYTHIGFLNGYFLALGAGTVRVSDLFDGTNYDPLVFFARSALPDDWIALLTDPYGYAFLPGANTAESWYPTESASNPFALDRASLTEEGIAAPFSLKQAGKSKVWLSTNANGGFRVMRTQGFTPQRISNFALEQQIASYGDVSNAFGETYEDQGHAFYLLTFPSVPITWVYNFGTGFWHQQGTWIAEENRFTYWRPTCHVFAFNKHIALDRESNALYEVSTAFATDVEERPIRRVRRSPAVTNENKMLFFDTLELLMDTGVGVVEGDEADEDPQVFLRASDDFGRTWGPERAASVGVSGAYGQRVQWWGLGASRQRVYEVSASAGVPLRVIEAYQKVRGSKEMA
jgi:hypothetical protein